MEGDAASPILTDETGRADSEPVPEKSWTTSLSEGLTLKEDDLKDRAIFTFPFISHVSDF